MRVWPVLTGLVLFAVLSACAGVSDNTDLRSTESPPAEASLVPPPSETPSPMPSLEEPAAPAVAVVISVAVSGQPGAYRFAVEIQSPDLGCDQYADWWEVLLEDGTLIYRRILAHSHVSEQPFVRSGGPVAVEPDTIVLVRAHMAPGGYGGAVMRGTSESGFTAFEVGSDFAVGLANQPPLPDSCAF